jgi:hypothetical protein
VIVILTKTTLTITASNLSLHYSLLLYAKRQNLRRKAKRSEKAKRRYRRRLGIEAKLAERGRLGSRTIRLVSLKA